MDYNPLSGFLGSLGWAIAVALVAVVASLFLQPQMERVSEAITTQPLITGGFGMIAAVVSVLALIVMAVTIILIPVSMLGVVILSLAWLFGLVALGYEVGLRLAKQLKQSWTVPLSAGLGTLLLMLVIGALTGLVPCVGGLATVLVGLAGLGGVVLTRFGMRLTRNLPWSLWTCPPPPENDPHVIIFPAPTSRGGFAVFPSEKQPFFARGAGRAAILLFVGTEFQENVCFPAANKYRSPIPWCTTPRLRSWTSKGRSRRWAGRSVRPAGCRCSTALRMPAC